MSDDEMLIRGYHALKTSTSYADFCARREAEAKQHGDHPLATPAWVGWALLAIGVFSLILSAVRG